jgi:hypothetical protein
MLRALANTPKVRKWRDYDVQGGRRQRLLSGNSKDQLNGRHAPGADFEVTNFQRQLNARFETIKIRKFIRRKPWKRSSTRPRRAAGPQDSPWPTVSRDIPAFYEEDERSCRAIFSAPKKWLYSCYH